jgi:putative Mg2+ transporter-C (MgtC) family protein
MPPELNFAVNLVCAGLMGAAIGLERQWRQHPAGLRTNALVTVGAATFVSLGPLMLGHKDDTLRVAAQVVSGIGFLGGGVILREGFTVRGMATAATLWCSAAVGVLAGAGYLAQGAIATVTVLLTHISLRPIALYMEARLHGVPETESRYRIRVHCPADQGAVIRSILLRHINSKPYMTLTGLATHDAEEGGHMGVVADVLATQRNDRLLEEIVSRLCIEPGVHAVSWERVVT